MKIYFAGSIRGGRDDTMIYKEIISHLKNYGEVFTEHVGDQSLAVQGGDGADDRSIYKRDMKWLYSANILVAEVSTPSLGVGFEIAQAIQWNKRVLCLYRPQRGKKLSALITGCSKIFNVEYTALGEAKKAIDIFCKKEKYTE